MKEHITLYANVRHYNKLILATKEVTQMKVMKLKVSFYSIFSSKILQGLTHIIAIITPNFMMEKQTLY